MSKQSGKLQAIANEMKQTIETGHRSAIHKPLPSGLQLVIQRKGRNVRLAMAREKVYPSDVEVSIIKAAFKVPDGTEESRFTKLNVNRKTNREIFFNVVEMTWTEEPAVELVPA